ncbi:MAG: hypothetical protein CRN43_14240 [Candidatus Nephrothrix sp. EaCA]|nr:MAG: hypothetical protein CRN43_14240 [Candidatus Nephrothrix sp. EaCA]
MNKLISNSAVEHFDHMNADFPFLTDIKITETNSMNQATVCPRGRPPLLYFLFFLAAHFFLNFRLTRICKPRRPMICKSQRPDFLPAHH